MAVSTKHEELTLEDVMELIDNFDYAAYVAEKKLRKERPWVLDIIRVLWPRKWGLRIADLEDELRAVRNPQLAEDTPKLPEPKKFRETIQSVLNHHTSQSDVFRNQLRPPEDDLFYSPKGKGSGIWAVHQDRAVAWLRKRRLPPV